MDLLILIVALLLNLLVVLAAVLFIVWLVQSILYKAPFLPLPAPVVDKVADMMVLTALDRFYDLGSGDGRVVRALAKRYPLATCVGVEKAVWPNFLAWFHQLRIKYSNISYLKKDFRSVSLQETTALFLYLWPSVMTELSGKFKSELPFGARIISCQFELPGFRPTNQQTVLVEGKAYQLFIYENNLKDNSVQ